MKEDGGDNRENKTWRGAGEKRELEGRATVEHTGLSRE